jgi:hypothetical protein
MISSYIFLRDVTSGEGFGLRDFSQVGLRAGQLTRSGFQ